MIKYLNQCFVYLLMSQKEKGQYFTTSIYLQSLVSSLIFNESETILEPCIGRGDLINYVLKNRAVKFDMIEIDDTIKLLDSVNKHNVCFCDFLKTKIEKKYDTIIGNPPFVKTRTGNLYLDFIDKCFQLLNDKGELIFITPSDFIKLSGAANLINKMLKQGTFTHIYHPHNESLFENASIDVIVFRYCRDKTLDNRIKLNDETKYLVNTNGILTFSDNEPSNLDYKIISDYFEVYVGMVTGKESVFKNSKYGNTQLLTGKDTIENYILIDSFPTNKINLNKYMLSHKQELLDRKIRKFNNDNWYEWGALRNYNTIKNNLGKNCLYINTVTRADKVCFKSHVQYFGGNLIIMIPKNTSINLDSVVDYLNSECFKKNYMYSGRFKIGHKQLCNALLNIPSEI